MQKIDFMNVLSRLEYTVNMTCKWQILLMKKQILSLMKNRYDYCEIQTWKIIQIWHLNLDYTISLGV